MSGCSFWQQLAVQSGDAVVDHQIYTRGSGLFDLPFRGDLEISAIRLGLGLNHAPSTAMLGLPQLVNKSQYAVLWFFWIRRAVLATKATSW